MLASSAFSHGTITSSRPHARAHNAIDRIPFTGRTALYITDRVKEKKPASSLIREFGRWKMIAEFEITERGLPLRQFRVFACSDYRQPEL